MPTITIDAQEFINDVSVDYSTDRETWCKEYTEDALFMRLKSGDAIMAIIPILSAPRWKEEGQHPLNLDETQLESTGKSVSVDDVIAKIDELTTDKE